MGYITTLSIYNDGLENIKQNPVEFAEKVYNAANSGLAQDAGLGNFANLIRVHSPRHADDATIYIHAGNCVTEFNAFAIEHKQDCKQGFFKKSFNRKLLKILVQDTNTILESLSSEEIYDLLVEDVPIIPKEKLPEEYHNKLLAKSLTDEMNNSIKQYLMLFCATASDRSPIL